MRCYEVLLFYRERGCTNFETKTQLHSSLRSNFDKREFNSREHHRFFSHNSEPCGYFGTILRHKLPIIHPDLPIPTRDLNSSVQPEFLNPKFLYKTEKTSRVLTAERKIASLIFAIRIRAMMIISEYYQLDVLGSNSFLENVAK